MNPWMILYGRRNTPAPEDLDFELRFDLTTFNRAQFIQKIYGLKTLVFGPCFNQFIVELPPNLEELYFGGFNHPIRPGYLPRSLRVLVFGDSFNQKIDNVDMNPGSLMDTDRMENNEKVLPPHLEILEFGMMFNQPIGPGVLPPSLNALKFGHRFNQHVSHPDVFPNSLKTLEFGVMFNKPIGSGVLPNSLKKLVFRGRFNHGYGNDRYSFIRHDLMVKMLPGNLKELHWDNDQQNLKLFRC